MYDLLLSQVNIICDKANLYKQKQISRVLLRPFESWTAGSLLGLTYNHF